MVKEFPKRDNRPCVSEDVQNKEQLDQIAALLEFTDSEMLARLCLQPQWLQHLKDRQFTNSR